MRSSSICAHIWLIASSSAGRPLLNQADMAMAVFVKLQRSLAVTNGQTRPHTRWLIKQLPRHHVTLLRTITQHVSKKCSKDLEILKQFQVSQIYYYLLRFWRLYRNESLLLPLPACVQRHPSPQRALLFLCPFGANERGCVGEAL